MTSATTLTDEGSLAHRVLIEQVTLMCRLMTVLLPATVIVGAMIAWLTAPVRGPAVSLAWYGLLVIVVAARWQLARRYLARPRDADLTRRWRSWLLALGALAGAIWSVSGTWLLPAGTVRETIVAVLLIGGSAAALNTHVPVRHAYAALLVPLALPLAVYQFMMGGDRIVAGIALLLYIPAMIVIVNRQTGATENRIRLLLENQRLVHALERERERVEEANRLLQAQVAQQNASAGRIRALNSELEKQMAELRAANKDLEGFSYSVSHDLRAPLRAIDAFAVLLEERLPGGDPAAERCLARIRSNAARMSALIDDLLAFARCGRKPIERRVVDMAQLARRALDEVRNAHALASEPRVAIDALPTVQGDPELLLQVWVNLIDNAFKYTSRVHQPQVEISAREEGDEAIFEVVDNGIGFERVAGERVFDPFERLHGELGYPGTGVGLAIVQRIVARHGGRVWARAEPQRGATFGFSLPKTLAASTPAIAL